MEILLNIIYYIVPFIILLGVLVFVHEFGHFIIARLLGVGVSAFSIGFGKELWSRTDKHGTTWKICTVPLGGYCQFLGDADASSSTEDKEIEKLSDEEKKHAFAYQMTWKKLAIVVAGPAFNYLFAILVFIGIFYCYGKIVYPSVVSSVLPGEAAAEAGIKAGDKILSINDNPTPDFQSVSNEISLATEDEIKIKLERPLTFNLKAEETELPRSSEEEPRKEKILGLISQPVCTDSENGERREAPAVVGSVIPNSAAARAGLAAGDNLESINGEKLADFAQLKNYVSSHLDAEFEIKANRIIFVTATLRETDFDAGNGKKVKRRMLGIQSMPGVIMADNDMSFGKAVSSGFEEAWDLTMTTLRAVGQMITGQRGGKDVGGIIRIAEMSGDVSKSGGLIGFIYFMALLSVNLGLINLLPIPVLDGGHVVIFLCEMITRRELKPQVKDYIFKFGLVLILAIMILATWNDVVHLINRWFD